MLTHTHFITRRCIHYTRIRLNLKETRLQSNVPMMRNCESFIEMYAAALYTVESKSEVNAIKYDCGIG